MCRCVGVWVGMWVHARRLTGGQPRRVRAGPDFRKYSRSYSRSCSRSYAEAVLLSKSMHCIDLLRRTGRKAKKAKNLDVMGFEPMTSGLEPAPLTTRQLGPCLKMVAVRRFWRSEQKVLGGRSDQKLQFSKSKKWVCYDGAKRLLYTNCFAF